MAAAATLALMAACGGSSSNNADGGGGVCLIKLTGGQNGIFPCGNELIVFDMPGNRSKVTINGAGGFPPPFAIAVTFPGEPRTGTTFRSTDSGAQGQIVVGGTTDTQSWTAGAGNANGSDNQGSYTITFTSVSPTASSSDGKIYSGHGTVDGTLPASPGSTASGTVTLHADF